MSPKVNNLIAFFRFIDGNPFRVFSTIFGAFSWGAMKEIACAQYFNKKKIYILKEFISRELPKELKFLVEYISIKEIEGKIKN